MLRFKRLNPIKHGENNNVSRQFYTMCTRYKDNNMSNVSVKDGIEYHLILNICVRTVLAPVVLTVIY